MADVRAIRKTLDRCRHPPAQAGLAQLGLEIERVEGSLRETGPDGSAPLPCKAVTKLSEQDNHADAGAERHANPCTADERHEEIERLDPGLDPGAGYARCVSRAAR